jgi:hypothetical protein
MEKENMKEELAGSEWLNERGMMARRRPLRIEEDFAHEGEEVWEVGRDERMALQEGSSWERKCWYLYRVYQIICRGLNDFGIWVIKLIFVYWALLISKEATATYTSHRAWRQE